MTEQTTTETQTATYVSPAMKARARDFSVDIADLQARGMNAAADRMAARRARWAATVGYPLH